MNLVDYRSALKTVEDRVAVGVDESKDWNLLIIRAQKNAIYHSARTDKVRGMFTVLGFDSDVQRHSSIFAHASA